jgi:hypothetical protein
VKRLSRSELPQKTETAATSPPSGLPNARTCRNPDRSNGVQHEDIPMLPWSDDARLDGSKTPIRTAPGQPQDYEISKTLLGPNKIRYTLTQGGKPVEEGTYTLSADGKKLFDTYRGVIVLLLGWL